MTRTLLIARGIPGSGKSTFMEEKGLTPFVLSPDHLRLLHQSPRMKTDGTWHIAHEHEKAVWKLVMELTEKRMKQGDFVIIDATHTRAKDINQYRTLAHTYRYRVMCLDFSSVPLDTCLERNAMRDGYKRVPDEAVHKLHARIQSSEIPGWVTTLTPDQFDDWYRMKPWDVNQYDRIHHIGDIHGCDEPLETYFKEGLRDTELYIFVGDYLDRGIQNAEVMDRLLAWRDQPNVLFLEGNHESHLKRWAQDERANSRDFERYTRPQLEEARISQKAVRMFAQTWQQFVYYTYRGKEVLVSHGGLATIPDSLFPVASEQFIRGVGDYDTLIDEVFTAHTHPHQYQIHGHRNKQELPVFAASRSFNLEGKVESGGHLRVVTLDEDGFKAVEVPNTTIHEKYARAKAVATDNWAFLEDIRSNNMVREEKQGHTNISSFSFKKNVFFDATWDAQTMRARGLFINTETSEICARSYDKFFNLHERKETTVDALSTSLSFPVRAYEKENGFLGICGYNSEIGELMLASKSKMYGKYAEWFKELFHKVIPVSREEELKTFLQTENATLVFEVIDPVNDPHLIEYEHGSIVLLDVVQRTPTYKKAAYEEVVAVAERFSLPVKKRAGEWSDWTAFHSWMEKATTDWDRHIEGYVVEDAKGFLFKIKCPYYSAWKRVRTLKERLERGKELPDIQQEHPSIRPFVEWMKEIPLDELKKTDIIQLRHQYESSQ